MVPEAPIGRARELSYRILRHAKGKERSQSTPLRGYPGCQVGWAGKLSESWSAPSFFLHEVGTPSFLTKGGLLIELLFRSRKELSLNHLYSQ